MDQENRTIREPDELSTTQEPDIWVPPPNRHPTHAEVREIIGAILNHIDSSPDWWTELRNPTIRPADEAYFQKPLTKSQDGSTTTP